MNRDTLMVYVEIVIKSILAGFIYLILKYLQECGYFNNGFNFSSSLVIGSLVLIYIVKKFIKIVKSYRFDVVIVSIGTFVFTAYAVKLNFIRLAFNILHDAATINLRYVTFPILICLLVFVVRILQKKCLELYANKCEATFFSGNNPEEDLLGIQDKAKEISESLINGGSSDPLIFGIDAPWGMGKTRFIEACFEELEKVNEVIVLKFNALRYRNQGEISEHLINELVATIKETNYVPELDTTYKRYARILANRKNIWFDFFTALFRIDTKSYSITGTIKSLENCHKQLGKKIIILIDDFDRLDVGVQRKTLHALSEVFHLPYVTFVICYDTENLKKIGAGYFEKYVDVKYNLYLRSDEIGNYVIQLLDEIKSGEENLFFDEDSIGKLKEEFGIHNSGKLKEKIDTPRKAKRLVNQLLLWKNSYVPYEKVRNIKLHCILTWIYVYEPELFNCIRVKVESSIFIEDLLGELKGVMKEYYDEILKEFQRNGSSDEDIMVCFKGSIEIIVSGYSTTSQKESKIVDFIKKLNEFEVDGILSYFKKNEGDNEEALFDTYRRIINNKKLDEKNWDKLLGYLIEHKDKHVVFESEKGYGFRESIPYFMIGIIDKYDEYEKIKAKVDEVIGVTIKHILDARDLLAFRISCYSGRMGRWRNLYSYMDTDNLKKKSESIFSKIWNFISNKNIFELICNFAFKDLIGDYTFSNLGDDERNKILDNEKNKLMQFVIYQLTNAEKDSMGWGCGCYELNGERIQEVMSKYIMKKIVEKNEYLIRYLYVCIKSSRNTFPSFFGEELDDEDKKRLMEDIAKTFSEGSLKKCVEENWKKIIPEEKPGYFYWHEEKVTYEEAYKEVDSYVSVWAKPEENNTQTKVDVTQSL